MTTHSLRNGLSHLFHPKRAEAPKTEKKAEAPKQEAQQPAQKQADTGRYQTSYSGGKEINRNYSKSGGQDTSDLFTPNKPTKAGNTANSVLKGLGIGFSKDGAFDARIEGKKGSASYSGMGGLATASASYTLGELSAKGQGHIGLDGTSLTATGSVEARAELLHAEAKAHFGKGDYNVDAHAEVDIGAKASAHGELTIDPAKGIFAAKVGGEAFAGARAGAEAKVNLGKFGSAGARAEAWAGVGASFKAEAGFKDGRLKARFELGAALGIGFKLGFNVDIDLRGIKNAVTKVIKAPVEAVKNVAHAVGNALKKLKFW